MLFLFYEKKNTFKGELTYIFGDLGRSWSIFRDLGSKGKILLGSRGNYFQGPGEINALFSGIKGAQTPRGGLNAKKA